MYRTVLQARTSSKRLPAKVLLPIGKVPLVLACVKRLSSRSSELVVATSTHTTDDALAEMLEVAKVPVVRGPLDDVLGRYIAATEDLCDTDLIVRATADNPVPDGSFITDLVSFMMAENVEYAATRSPMDGLPYGLSAEVMTVGALRRAHLYANSATDREHVTPWLARNCTKRYISHRHWNLPDQSYLRCTIDTFDDFERMRRLFASISEPIDAVSWREILRMMSVSNGRNPRTPFRIRDGRAESVITLGTAQLGMEYGYNNKAGQPESNNAIQIIRTAIEQGVTWLDTAAVYGNAESRIGVALAGSWRERCRVITKLAPMPETLDSNSRICADALVEASVYRSLYRLNFDKLDVLMLHRWRDRHVLGGAAWNRMVTLRNEGRIEQLGASVYRPADAIEALTDPDILHIQIPFNVLDERWLASEFLRALEGREDVRVHVRSIFMQGLLFTGGDRWPVDDVKARMRIASLDHLVSDLERRNRADLCIAYVRSHSWIDSLVLGVESMEQLNENLHLGSRLPLSEAESQRVRQSMQGAPDALLDPSRWST